MHCDITKDALSSLRTHWVHFYLLPAVLAGGTGAYTYFLDKELSLFGDVVGPIGIFSALMFSVIFIVVEHFLKRRDACKSENEEDIQYLENYQDFTRNTVARISFSIFLAGLIIIMAFIFPQVKATNIWWLSARNTVFAFFLLQYIVNFFIVVKDMYAMLTDDIEHK